MNEPDQPTDIAALLADLAAAEHDVLSLARRHGLTFDQLVAWANRAETRRTLAGLCVLADAQTQLLLSRYRLVAATRLIAQATAEPDTLGPEQVRKACVDLLKAELSRAADLAPDDADPDDAELDRLREAMLGQSHTDDLRPGTADDDQADDQDPC